MTRSVKLPDSSRTFAPREKPPGVPLEGAIEAADLMLATLRASPFSRPGWTFELKVRWLPVLSQKGVRSRFGLLRTLAFRDTLMGKASCFSCSRGMDCDKTSAPSR